jgi:RNA polymerase sigma-70 factor (ECF subfamily)
LAELCQIYWYPLYAYVRRRTQSREEAEDLTQGFFERFLEKNYLEGLSADRGKFRAFLLAALKHYLANAWDKAGRQKRGGGVGHLSLDWPSADQRYQVEPADRSSPDRMFDRAWALALLERVLGRLEAEYALEGRAELFRVARGFLMVGVDSVPYADAGRGLGMTEGTMRVAVHRLRKRYRQLLRDEIAETLSDPAQVEEELHSLQAALRD